LFLRILRKRPDGFHDLASLFQCIGFGDVLQLQISEQQDAFECNMPGVPVDSTNLVVRAINVMRKKTGNESQKFNVKLTKQVPAQAGLGGGSANAATAMWGANELMGKPATLNEMVEWSAELGSDITFFLSRGTAYCTGRGEIMTPVDPPLESGTPVCLVKPNVGLSTPSVFSALDYDLLSTVDPEELLEDFVQHGVYGVQKESFLNDLEPPAFKCVPMLRTLKEELQQVPGFTQVLMSGSGSTIFCIGSPEDKEAFMKEFGEREDLQVFFSEFINRKEGEWFERPKGVE
jgi:4-diphosphocytidyl-2-C-methyl-D-erythritol kinase